MTESKSRNFENSQSLQIADDLSHEVGHLSQTTSLKMLNKRQSDFESELQKRTVLKKREDFAISLRKKKHSEIISTKRKANMQRAFERTIVSSSEASHLGLDEHMEIRDLLHLSQVIQYLDAVDTQPSDRILMLRGIRYLTIHCDDY
jgi:hypothetical protein